MFSVSVHCASIVSMYHVVIHYHCTPITPAVTFALQCISLPLRGRALRFWYLKSRCDVGNYLILVWMYQLSLSSECQSR